MAERARFELAEDKALSSFRDYRLQPLGHLSCKFRFLIVFLPFHVNGDRSKNANWTLPAVPESRLSFARQEAAGNRPPEGMFLFLMHALA